MSEVIERDCTRLCRSEQHAIEITGAITKRAVSDEAIASYIRKLCWNFNQVYDDEGRSALHMAASQGRVKLLEWLVRNSPKVVVHSRDKESGYTALHRSIFYGQIAAAVKLIELGVYTGVLDNDGLKPLELATLDHNYLYRFCDRKINPEKTSEPCEIYVWGINANYTLGTGDRQRRTPDILQFFNRGNVSVRQVCIGKFHTVFVTSTGKVWACGQIGRAGAVEQTTIEPKEIKLPELCIAASVMLDSTVFWLQNNTFVEYSINKESTITPTKTKKSPAMTNPKLILKLGSPLGMCTSRVHGVIWASDAVYTWGYNNGQLGHSHHQKYVTVPQKASMVYEKVPALAAASDAATVVYVNSEVILLHKKVCKKIIYWVPGIKQMCVDAKMEDNGTYSRVTLLLLTKDGHLELWRDGFVKNTLLGFRRNHQLIVNHVAFVNEIIYLTTINGEVFSGVITRKNCADEEDRCKKIRKYHFDAQRTFSIVKTTRVANLHRAISINVDYEGLNFACVQAKPTCGMKFIPQISPSRIYDDLLDFLENATVDDLLHDVTFKIGTRVFPAHMFIIATKSEPLHELYLAKIRRLKKGQDSHGVVIELYGIHPDVFDRILKYIYGGICDVLSPGECSLKIKREDVKKEDVEGEEIVVPENPEEIASSAANKNMRKRARNRQKNLGMMDLYYDPVLLMQKAASDLGIRSLEWKLHSVFYNYQDGQIHSKINEEPIETDLGFERDYFMELVDTSVRSKEGHEIPVHKCVLAARLQYFNSMFTYAYKESKSQSVINLPISYNILVIIINFIYFDVCPEVQQSESIDFVCSVLIVADQFIIQRLLEMCELALSELVTVKNCADILQFAQMYNALQLKKYCMEYICFNLCQLLENRSLDGLDSSLLAEVTKFYSIVNPSMSYRVITPFCFAVSDDIVNEAHDNHPVDLNSIDEDLLLPFDFPKIEFEKVKKKKDKKKSEDDDKNKVNDSATDQPTDSEPVDMNVTPKRTDKEEENQWIKIPTAQQKLLQARLRAINSAKDIQNETHTESYVKLVRNSDDTPTSRSSTSPSESQVDSPKSSQGNITISHVGPKLSQKQRKRLASQNDSQAVNGCNKLPVESPPTPKNPWKLPEQPIPSCSSDFSPKTKAVQFNEILADQKKQKDDSSRIMSKPLRLTQLEDRAIEELERFYNVHEIDEEYITVRRVHVQMLAPQWVHNLPK